MQKGEALLLKGTADKEYTIPSKGVQATYENMFVGNTSGSEVKIGAQSDDGTLTNYYLKEGTFVSVNVSATIGDGRSYLQLPTEMLAGARGDGLGEELGGLAGLAEAETEAMPLILAETTNVNLMDNGKWIMDNASDQWYTMSGQRIDKPTKKGLYIHNGKKVIIK